MVVLARLTEQVTTTEMSHAAKACIVPVLMVQRVTMKMFRPGKRLSTAWETTAEFLLDAIWGGF